MLTPKSLREVEGLIRFPYYININSNVPVYDLSKWSNEVEISMYYCGGSVYFQSNEDLMAFQLRWC